MSDHVDPTKDEYLELEKKLGAAESALAKDLADADKTLDEARTTPSRPQRGAATSTI